MTNLSPPPINQQIVDSKGFVPMPWVLHFSNMYRGDTGTDWTPNFTSLASTGGTPTITGRYYLFSQQLVYITIDIVPAGGGDTTATAGTTYADNFPLVFTNNGFCVAIAGNLGSNVGSMLASPDRIFVPGWSAITVPVKVMGICEVRGGR